MQLLKIQLVHFVHKLLSEIKYKVHMHPFILFITLRCKLLFFFKLRSKKLFFKSLPMAANTPSLV